MSCPLDIVSGPIFQLTEFVVSGGGAPPNPAAIAIISGNINLINPAWVTATPTSIVYTPGPDKYDLLDGGELIGFSLSIPWP